MAGAAVVSDSVLECIGSQVGTLGFGLVAYAVESDDDFVMKVYTVGLNAKGLPEIILEGVEVARAVGLVGNVASCLLQRGVGADQVEELTMELEEGGVQLYIMRVETGVGQGKAPVAVKFSGSTRFVQMCIRDREGKWPWEPGFIGAKLHQESMSGGGATQMKQ